MDDGDGTLGLVIGCRLDKRALAREDRLKLGLFPYFVDFDGLGRSLEFDIVGFTFFLQSMRQQWSARGRRHLIREMSVPIKDLLDLHLGFLLIRL